jgi:hypothetical protein
MKILLMSVLLISNAFAQTPTDKAVETKPLETKTEPQIETKSEVLQDKKPEKKPAPKIVEKTSEDNREIKHGTIALGYQPLTLWIPGKLALSYTHLFNKKWATEFEYATASKSASIGGEDIGKLSEKRMVLQARYFTGNSFNLMFGVFSNDLKAELSGSIISSITTADDLLRVETQGITFGIGNRWQFDNGLSFGVDWFRINYASFKNKVTDKVSEHLTDQDDKDDLEDTIDKLKNIPTLVLFGLSLGYSF